MSFLELNLYISYTNVGPRYGLVSLKKWLRKASPHSAALLSTKAQIPRYRKESISSPNSSFDIHQTIYENATIRLMLFICSHFVTLFFAAPDTSTIWTHFRTTLTLFDPSMLSNNSISLSHDHNTTNYA